MPRMLLSILYVIGLGWLLLSLLLYVFQEHYVYFPSKRLIATPGVVGLGYESVTIHSSNGNRITGWYIPAPEPRGVLLFLHGNAGNISHRLHSLEIFHNLGLTTLIIDYQGYGESEGKPGEQATYADAESAWNYLTLERGYAPEEILIFGRSLGGAVATWLATRVNASGIILESTFSSARDVARKYYWYLPVGLILRIHYPAEELIPAIDSPILIVHSIDDEIIPFNHAEKLLNAAGDNARLLRIHGGHNDGFILSSREYVDGLKEFIDNRFE
jgi:uncharacterized protein